MEARDHSDDNPATEFKLRRGGVFYVDGYTIKIVRIRRGDVDISVRRAGPTLLTRSAIDGGREQA